ncbi:MAG TPA: hypothetical protein VHJ82_07500 [Actinomycetota bacterium]|nr:hypothetical protein [Actinomycetota bacterium]
MNLHDTWHVVVLAAALIGAAAGALLFIVPLVFDAAPEGFGRFRPALWVIVLVVAALLILEWTAVH